MTDPRLLSTSALSDALDLLGRPGAVWGLERRSGTGVVHGPAFPVRFAAVEPGRPAPAADYIDDVPSGAVVVLACPGVRATVWGDLLTEVALARGVTATVVDGNVRDVDRVRALDYPLWSRGVSMRSGKGRLVMAACGDPVTLGPEAVTVRPGDLVHADGSGVVVAPAGVADEVLGRAADVERMEAAISRDVAGGARLRDARTRHRYHDVSVTSRTSADPR